MEGGGANCYTQRENVPWRFRSCTAHVCYANMNYTQEVTGKRLEMVDDRVRVTRSPISWCLFWSRIPRISYPMLNLSEFSLNTQTACFYCRCSQISMVENFGLMIRYYRAPVLKESRPFSLTLISRYRHLSSCVISFSLKVASRVVRVIMTFNGVLKTQLEPTFFYTAFTPTVTFYRCRAHPSALGFSQMQGKWAIWNQFMSVHTNPVPSKAAGTNALLNGRHSPPRLAHNKRKKSYQRLCDR